jgi:hypothetical protein
MAIGDENEALVLHRSSRQTQCFDAISMPLTETHALLVSDALPAHPREVELTELPVYVITSI